MAKGFNSLFGWQTNSVFKLTASICSLTAVGAFTTSMGKHTAHLSSLARVRDCATPWEQMRVAALATTVAAHVPKNLISNLPESAVMKAIATQQTVGLANTVRMLATSGIFGGAVNRLTDFNSLTARLPLSSAVTSQLESALERMGGWDRIANSVVRHLSPEHSEMEAWEEDDLELEKAVAYVTDALAAGRAFEDIMGQPSNNTAIQDSYGIHQNILVGLVVAFILWLLTSTYDSFQKFYASLPAIHYAERHGLQLAVVVNKTGVNVRETNDESSFSVHRFDEGVYVLVMPGKAKNRREIAYLYDENKTPVKTGWVPPGSLRLVKNEERQKRFEEAAEQDADNCE